MTRLTGSKETEFLFSRETVAWPQLIEKVWKPFLKSFIAVEEHNVRLKQTKTPSQNPHFHLFLFLGIFQNHSLWQLVPDFSHTVTYCVVYMPSHCLLIWSVRAGLVCVREPSVSKTGEHSPRWREYSCATSQALQLHLRPAMDTYCTRQWYL